MMRYFMLLMCLLLPLQPAHAWGEAAHRTIARIALGEMTPATRSAIAQLLAHGDSVQTPGCALNTLEAASVWPDCVRSLGERYSRAAAWHYQNIALCRPFSLKGTCPGGNCITVQIRTQLAILHDSRAPVADRVQALAYVAHFVGDLHQPLHVSDRADRGGNEVALYLRNSTTPLNLHKLWDRQLAERALAIAPSLTAATPTAAQRSAWQQGDIIDWARESWIIAGSTVYADLPGFAGQCPTPLLAEFVVPEGYAIRALPVIRTQIERAGVRLAMLLDIAMR